MNPQVPLVRILLLACVLMASTAQAQLFWNQAAQFLGTPTSYLVIPNSPELNFTEGFTIECWVNVPTVSTNAILVQHRSGSADEGYTFYLALGRPAIRVGSTTRVRTETVIPTNQWVHLVGRYSASTGYYGIYINGTRDTSVAVSTPALTASTDSLRIGTGFNENFEGLMDELRIWNRPLGEVPEIAYHYRTSFGASGGIYDGLVLSLTFQDDEASGTLFSLTDWSGYGNSAVNRGVTPVDFSYTPPRYLSLNEGVLLDGDGDYLVGPDASAVSPTTAVTLQAWVHPLETGTGVIINKGFTATTPSYRFFLTTDNVLRAGINNTFVSAAGAAPPGRWTHVAFTYTSSGETYAFYINGQPAGSGTLSAGVIADGTDSLHIGGGQSLAAFNGYLDEVRIAGYAKSQEEIRSMMFVTMDQANEQSSGMTNVCYGFNGYTTDACADGGPRLAFNDDARFSNPAIITNTPVAPLGRARPSSSLPAGYRIRPSERRVPETGSSGTMIRDSIYCNENVSITDVNLFVATNHTFAPDLEISLVGPQGDSVAVCYDWAQRLSDDNITTVFDDEADSSYTGGGRQFSFGPVIRPAQSLNGVFTATNAQGWWVLHITDDAGGDTGRLYGWGFQINNQTVVGVDDAPSTPEVFRLAQNYPNPFNPVTAIEYDLPRTLPVTLEIFDILGRLVETPVNRVETAGSYSVQFNGAGRASGTYLYRLRAGEFVQTRKMLLVK